MSPCVCVPYAQAALKKYQIEHKSKGESLEKCQGELKKLRRKSQGSKNPAKYNDKELQVRVLVLIFLLPPHPLSLSVCLGSVWVPKGTKGLGKLEGLKPVRRGQTRTQTDVSTLAARQVARVHTPGQTGG